MAVHDIIVAMAKDMGIKQFYNESETQYSNRVIYSAMACWIKTVSTDQSITEKQKLGVSKKHIYEKSTRILDEMLLRYPQSKPWFSVNDEEDPIIIIRQRLLQNGDLVNVGYDTNVGLAIKEEIGLGYGIRQLVGSIYERGYIYSGIALTSSSLSESIGSSDLTTIDWFNTFIKNAWWKAGSCINNETEYFDVEKCSPNNYSCWSLQRCKLINSVMLTRNPLHNQAYEYILVKIEHGITYYHRLDTFLQESKEHRRMMFALRSLAKNPVEVKKYRCDEHVQLVLRTFLPDKERIVLETFAWPHETITDKLKWDMPLFIWPYVQTFLTRLGVKIMEEKHEQV